MFIVLHVPSGSSIRQVLCWYCAQRLTQTATTLETACPRCAEQPLEGVERHKWLCFERALVLRDTYAGGSRTFLSQEDAQAFREAVYRSQGSFPLHTARIGPEGTDQLGKRACSFM